MKKEKLDLENWTVHHIDGTVSKITEDNFHKLSKRMQEAIGLRQKKGRGFFLQPKFYISLYEVHKNKLSDLHSCNPDMPISKVLAQRLEDIPDYIPADKVKEFTNFVFATWEELSVKESVAA